MPWEEPWFVKRVRAIIHALLYDEEASKRWALAAAVFVCLWITSGGVVPGTQMVVPVPAWLSVKAAALGPVIAWFLGGGKINRAMNEPPPPPPPAT